jgi:hypothetical protein
MRSSGQAKAMKRKRNSIEVPEDQATKRKKIGEKNRGKKQKMIQSKEQDL